MSNLTIILLIKGREKFTKRWLDYMSAINYPDQILIGDGDIKSNVKKIIKKKKYRKLKIKYISYNNKNYKDYYFMMYDLVKNHIKSEYLRFCDNDDFILKKQQNNLKEFFNKNKKYISVGDFQIRFEILGKNKLYGNKNYFFFEGIHRHEDKFNENAIIEIFNKYQGNFYNLFRRKDLAKILFEIYKLNFSDLEIKDFYFKLRLLTIGKTIYLNQSSYIRQHGTSQTSSNFYYSENFINKDIKKDLIKMSQKISKILKYKFGKKRHKIENLITNCYKNYLNITIAHNKREFLYPNFFKFKKYFSKNFINLLLVYRKLKYITFFMELKKLYKYNMGSFNEELKFLKNFLKINN